METKSFRINKTNYIDYIAYSNDYAGILPGSDHILDIYFSSLIPCPDDPGLFPPERNDYLKSTKLDHARSQSYTAWKLLEIAIKHSFDMSMQELSPHKLASGKWVSSSRLFSLSHTKTSAAVAVSDSDVGIDIEDADTIKMAFELMLETGSICLKSDLEAEMKKGNMLTLLTDGKVNKNCLLCYTVK